MLALLFIVALTNDHVGASKTVNVVAHHLQQQLAVYAHSHVYSDEIWVHDTLWGGGGGGALEIAVGNVYICVLHLESLRLRLSVLSP